mmetsp:Transcript_27089/g.59003  ORF Transcript_27089/g.59003 Transcript_27089/m.59003 type:complete len:351 (+) Transcript_27089:64-1116(+)|eukprot:CAMPEP_0206439020 /NCGR_PEP_ID=MMETSP0324_2-20121206/11970_1 /ASSEMBLY_ACC=CAM_ASM_000836 /TAXON_ID=2866 /ORGANISM="Crypthecodinium cohnii, Strain Seligo" /LENGTH=350 /DNA_ID=CAMNT_0053906577 /DNA_START=61 /DNA_END=1113 /DNA_ORIENTATION=+
MAPLCFTCCAGEDGGRSVEVVSTLAPGDESEHVIETNSVHAPPKFEAPAKVRDAEPESVVGKPINPDDVLHKAMKAGPPCRKRMPKVGDIVMSMGGKKVGHDAFGAPKRWSLLAGQSAEVMEVDADGDFRLRNLQNIESGFLFRREFCFAIDPNLLEEKQKEKERKQAEEEAPPPPPFDVELHKTAEDVSFGVRLDTMSHWHLGIVEVVDGLVSVYNNTAAEELKIKPGFYITGINGEKCTRDAILEAMRKVGPVTLRIAPAHIFEANLKRDGKVGLVLLVEPQSNSLLVSRVSLGCADDYNKTAKPMRQIKENDRIIEVNGVAEDVNKMLELTRQESPELRLKISRPSG